MTIQELWRALAEGARVWHPADRGEHPWLVYPEGKNHEAVTWGQLKRLAPSLTRRRKKLGYVEYRWRQEEEGEEA